MIVTANNRSTQELTRKVDGSTLLRDTKKEQQKTSPVFHFHAVRMQSASDASFFFLLGGLMYVN